MIVFSVAKLSILFLPLCFSQIDVRIHDGFIDFEYNKVMPTNGTLPLKAFTLEISLNDTTNNDYAISKCTMNSFNFFTYLGCFNSNDIFIARTETEDYNTKKIKKQTLVLFRSSRRQAKIVCDLILLRCRGCAKKSCQRGTEVSRYDLVSLNSVCERKNGSFACETVESSMTSKENSTDTTLKISDNAQSELFKSLKWALAFSIIAAVVAAICYFVAYSQKKHSGRVSTADYMSIFDEKEQATLLRDVRPRDVFRDDDPSASISLDMISIGEFSITTEQLPTVEDWNIVNSVYHTAPHCLRDEKLHDEEETNSKQDKGTETENNSSGEQASPHKNDDGSQLITGRNETGKKLRYENGIRDIPTRTEEEQADEVQSNDNTVAQLNGPPEVKPLWQRRAERRRNVSTILRKNSSRREKRKNGKNKERIDSSETQCPNNDFDMLPHENVPEYCNRKDAHTQNVRRESKKNQCPPAYDDYSSTRATQQYGEHYAEVLQFVFPSPKKLGRVTEVRDIPTSTEEEQGEEVQSNDNTVAQLNGPPEVKPLWQRRAERRRNISTILRKNSSRREKRKNGKNKERIDSSETQCPNNDFDMLSHENVPEYCNRKDAHTQNVRRESKKNQCPPVYDDYSSTRATQQHGEHYVEVLQFVFPSPKKLGRVTEVRDIPTSTEEEQEEEVQSNDNTVAQLNGPPEVKPLWQRRAERRRNISTILRKNSSRREKRKNGKNKERIDSSETQCPNNDFDMLPHENVPEYCNRKDAHTQNVRRESKKNQCPPAYDDYSSTRATQQYGEHYAEVLQFVFPSPKKLGRVTEVRDIPTSTEEEQGEEVQSNDNTVAQLNGPPEVKPLWQRRAERRRNISTILRKNSSRREKRKNGKNKERIDSSETQCPNNDFDMLSHENVPEYCNRKDAHTQNVRRESKKNQCPPVYDDYSSTRATQQHGEHYVEVLQFVFPSPKKLGRVTEVRDIPTSTEEEQEEEVQSNDNTVAQLNGPPEVKPLWQRRAERRRNISTILRKNSSRREKRKNGKNKERIDSSETQCPNNDFDMLPHENVPEYCNRKDAHTQNVRRESKKNQCPPVYDDYSSTRATQQHGEHYVEVLQFVFPSPKKLGRVTEVRDIPTSTEEEQGEEVQSNDNTVAQLNGPPEVKPLWQRRAERRRNVSTILRKNSSRREKRKNGKNKERIDSSETQCPNNDFDMLPHENVPEYCNRKDAHTQNVRRESKKNQCPPAYDDYSSTRTDRTAEDSEDYCTDV